MPEFYCFYREEPYDKNNRSRSNGGYEERDFYPSRLPKFIFSKATKYSLRVKPAFWRVYQQSESNGEKYYYQQIVTKKAIFDITFSEMKGSYPTWRGKLCYIN